VETWKDMYSYLCDCVKVIEPSEIEPTSSRDHFVLSKGVELLSETNPDEGTQLIGMLHLTYISVISKQSHFKQACNA
jgi:hypothetical protein